MSTLKVTPVFEPQPSTPSGKLSIFFSQLSLGLGGDNDPGSPGDAVGPSGSVGDPGSPGEAFGPSGVTGTLGSPGDASGVVDSPGEAVGPSGDAGVPGSPGEAVGPSGEAGFPGSPGDASGVVDSPGEAVGPSGEAGVFGSPGEAGDGEDGLPGSSIVSPPHSVQPKSTGSVPISQVGPANGIEIYV